MVFLERIGWWMNLFFFLAWTYKTCGIKIVYLSNFRYDLIRYDILFSVSEPEMLVCIDRINYRSKRNLKKKLKIMIRTFPTDTFLYFFQKIAHNWHLDMQCLQACDIILTGLQLVQSELNTLTRQCLCWSDHGFLVPFQQGHDFNFLRFCRKLISFILSGVLLLSGCCPLTVLFTS